MISIPSDGIWIVSLLIIFGLIGYFFNKIFDKNTSQIAQKISDDSNIELVKEKLEDQLKLEATTLDKKTVKKPSIKKLHLLPSSRLLGLSSLAIIAMGGASFLGIQSMRKSYEGVNNSQANVKLESQSTKYLLSIEKAQTKIKNINYIDPFFLATKHESKYNNYYQVKAKNIENNFSF